MNIALLGAAALLTPAQEPQEQTSAWQHPVSIRKVDCPTFPMRLYEAEGTVRLLVLTVSLEGRSTNTLSLFRQRKIARLEGVGAVDDVGFELAWERPLGHIGSFPAGQIHNGNFILVYGADRDMPVTRSVDLATGEASEAASIKIQGLDRIEDDFLSTIVEHQDNLFYMGAKLPRGDNEIFLLRSGDSGKSWVATGNEWRVNRKDGTRVLLFSTGGELHVVFRSLNPITPPRVRDGLVHLVSSDCGESWERGAIVGEPRAPSEEELVEFFPMAVHAKEMNVWLVFAEIRRSGKRFELDQATLRLATSTDAGSTWKVGGRLLETGIEGESGACQLEGNASWLVFTGFHRKPEEGRESGRSVCLASGDGGVTWRDLCLGSNIEQKRREVFGITAFTANGSTLLATLLETPGAPFCIRPMAWDSELLFRGCR